MNAKIPEITIGVPVHNGENTLEAALDSLLAQTFTDFEIIISDNASTDGTENICREFAARDPRIRYVRQAINIGATRNFKFVLDEACAPYFMWAATDDIRSPDFVDANIKFLQQNPDYVASTSPNCFEGQEPTSENLMTFALDGNLEERFETFFENCWLSHGIFYAISRRKVLIECSEIGKTYLAVDWSFNLFMASKGKIHRSRIGLMTSGAAGISNSANAWRDFRTSFLSWLLPLHRVSFYAFGLSGGTTLKWRLGYAIRLLKLNMFAAHNQVLAEHYPFYREHIRPLRQRFKGQTDK